MKYTTLSKKSDSYFQRKTGVKKPTFQKMVEIVKSSIANRRTRRGNEATFPVEDQLLIMLQYYREYPTFFSLGDMWGIHESTAQRTVRRMEDILIADGTFSLPGNTGLQNLTAKDLVLIDVTESPIERPKKNSVSITRVRKNDIQ